MKKSVLLIIVALAALIGNVSCKKINDLDERLSAVETSLSQLKSQVDAGAIVTSVEDKGDAIIMTLSNGNTYKISNGEKGADGEAIIADFQIEDYFIVLTLKDGEILRISYRNPVSLVSISIIPDYSDGSIDGVCAAAFLDQALYSLSLNVAVTPVEFGDDLADTDRFIHKAVFTPAKAKSNMIMGDFSIVASKVAFIRGTALSFLNVSFDLDPLTAEKLNNSQYVVSFSIEDNDGTNGVATGFVPVNSDGEGDPNEGNITNGLPSTL